MCLIDISIYFLLFVDYLLSGLPVEATLTQVMTLCQLTGEAIVDNNVGLQPIRFFSMTINRTSPESDRIRIFYAQFQIAILDDDGRSFKLL